MNSPRLLIALLSSGFASLSFAQTGTFSPELKVLNNLNYTAGSNWVGIAASDTASIFFTRSVGSWSDTWWQWTMGTDNKLRLGFSTVPQLTFQNGALGIGVDNPSAKLDVAGNVRVGGDLVLGGNPGGANKLLLNSASDTHFIRSNGWWTEFVSHPNEGWRFISNGGADSNQERLRIVAGTGNVGIGTTNPGAKLDVAGTIRSLGSGFQAWGSGQLQLQFLNQGDDTDQRITELIQQGGTFTGRFVNDAYGAAQDWLSVKRNAGTYTVKNVIFPSGNVGIGTSNPTHKLAVNGTIKAKEIIVETTGWSDYVFADDYRLAPLAEVEAHIKTNKHLPGIPSAAEVADQGVSLGDMQARLLAKIEELTLHQIAQEKRLAALEAENKQLRANR